MAAAGGTPHMGRRSGAPVLYRQVPLLLKPPKRTPAHALPSALHIGISSSLSVLVFGIINAAVTKSLGPTNKWSKLVQSGTLIAMVTCTILAMPNLGNSVIKAVQRIVGVMIGGWVFFGLYAGCQAWWFLAICLGVWAFLLVAASFWLTGKQFLFPVALVTAFVVATNFNSVQQAFTMTLVKTVAISGAIVIYTAASILLFPQTATQQVINALSDVLADLHKLADTLLVSGPGADDTAAAAAAESAANAADAKAAGKKAKKAAAPAPSKAAVLAARISFQLQAVQQLLPATRKERYVGTIGRYRCFLPSVRPSGLDETAALATVFNMSQVMRTLINMLLEFGSVPMAARPPPSHMVVPPAEQLVAPLAQQAVATLQDLAQALPRSRLPSSSVPYANLSAYGDTLRQLIACTVGGAAAMQQQAPDVAAAAGAASPPAADGVAGKWQRAAAAAAGVKLGNGGQAQALSAQQIASAFGQLLSDAVISENAQLSSWCSMLVLNRQLGKALMGLAGSMNVLLPQLPGH